MEGINNEREEFHEQPGAGEQKAAGEPQPFAAAEPDETVIAPGESVFVDSHKTDYWKSMAEVRDPDDGEVVIFNPSSWQPDERFLTEQTSMDPDPETEAILRKYIISATAAAGRWEDLPQQAAPDSSFLDEAVARAVQASPGDWAQPAPSSAGEASTQENVAAGEADASEPITPQTVEQRIRGIADRKMDDPEAWGLLQLTANRALEQAHRDRSGSGVILPSNYRDVALDPEAVKAALQNHATFPGSPEDWARRTLLAGLTEQPAGEQAAPSETATPDGQTIDWAAYRERLQRLPDEDDKRIAEKFVQRTIESLAIEAGVDLEAGLSNEDAARVVAGLSPADLAERTNALVDYTYPDIPLGYRQQVKDTISTTLGVPRPERGTSPNDYPEDYR